MEIVTTNIAEMLSFTGTGIALLGATLAIALSAAGTAKGTGYIGEAGAGLLAEDPSKFSKILILSVIPGSNALYGLVIWFMALAQLGAFSDGLLTLTLAQGMAFFAACLPMAIGGGLSAVAQGRVAASAVGLLARREGEWAKGIILCILIEFFAILSLLASFLTLVSIVV